MLNEIPYGNMCYIVSEIDDVIHVCPFYQITDDGVCYCSMCKISSEENELLFDKIKICGVNEGSSLNVNFSLKTLFDYV